MKPTVSIIVPVYNAEKFLNRCVDSILGQEYRDFELILVDDGSRDMSGSICDAYAKTDERVVVIHKENSGVSDTRNQGVERAKGTYLQFVDSDDWLTPDATKLMVRAAEEHGCDMVISDFYRVVGDMVSRKGDIESDRVIDREEFASFMMENPADYYYGVLWNKLYRRTYARQLAFDQAYTLGEDLQFVLDYLALLGRCQPDFSYLVLESALTFYDCSRTGTLSTKYHANYCEIWPKHFAKLNAACTAAACPPQDMLPLHRAELQVLAEGAADILRRDPDAMPARRAKARTALQSPWLKSLLDTMRHEHCYSPYYLPCRWNSLRLLWMLSEAARTQSPLFGKLDWAGYYLLLGRMKRG